VRTTAGDGLDQLGVEAGADALGLPGGGDGKLAQAHEAARADVLRDLREELAVPVLECAREGVAEA
jgi:putative intracellular protease/amidase